MRRLVVLGALYLTTSVVEAEVCRWKDGAGITHFAASCPQGVTPELRYGGGSVPFGAYAPGPSHLIEAAEALKAREAAAAEDKHIRDLRRMAKGNGKGLNQSYSEALVDKQYRDFARRELDRIERQKAGLPPKSELEERLDRVEAKVRRDRRRAIAEQGAMREQLRQQESRYRQEHQY